MERMEDKKLFRYVDTVVLSGKMTESLISGEANFRSTGGKSVHRSGFMALAGMAAVVCAVVVAGYMYFANDNFLPPVLQPDDSQGIIYTTEPAAVTDVPVTTAAVSPRAAEIEGFPTVIFRSVPFPENPHPDRNWWYFDLWGTGYVFDFYDSLKYHTDFADFEPRFEPLFPELFQDGIISSEAIASMVRDYLSDSYYEGAVVAIFCTLEQFLFDFLDYIKMPEEQIPYLFDIGWTELTGEWVRSSEIDSLYIALRVARAFSEGDADFLSGYFYSYTAGLFDFVNDMRFSDFRLMSTEFDQNTNEFLHYFNIDITEWDFYSSSPFDYGGSFFPVWVLKTDGHYIRQFTPSWREIDRVSWRGEHSDLALFCYSYSTFADFISEYYGDGNPGFQGLYIALQILYPHDVQQDEYGNSYFETRRFVELINYVFGIEIYDLQVLAQAGMMWQYADKVFLPGRGVSMATAELVREDRRYNDSRHAPTEATVIIDYYGDIGFMFLSRTVQYELIEDILPDGEIGWRLISTENIYENPNVNISFFHP
jgi:hypothetical protein